MLVMVLETVDKIEPVYEDLYAYGELDIYFVKHETILKMRNGGAIKYRQLGSDILDKL